MAKITLIRLRGIISSVVLVSLACGQSICPSVCSCKWKNGKQTAECGSQGLTIIPAGLNTETQVIDLSRNHMGDITSRAFQQKGLVNLQKIFMIECEITNIAGGSFFQLSNLVELDLTGNKLKSIPSDALKDCPNLRRLQLAHNPITQVESWVFSTPSHITFLDLSNCQIKHLQPGALKGLKRVEFLKLDSNQLTTLTIDTFKPLTQLFGLHLHNNPWYCDCKIRDVRTWMMERNIPLAVPPHCKGPAQTKGLKWDIMAIEEFACPPKLLGNFPEVVIVAIGQNASLLCEIEAIPKASLYWEIGGRNQKNLTFNPELIAKYTVQNDEASKQTKQSSLLTIFNAAETDADIYTCIAENKAGTLTVNFSLSVVHPNQFAGSWDTPTRISLLLLGIILVIILAGGLFYVFMYHPINLPLSGKITRKNVLQHVSSKNQDVVEMSDVREDKEEKDLKAGDKHPRHETGSSGYGSDQLTPDIVSKIVDMNNGPSLSTSTVSCNHLDPDNSLFNDGYGSGSEHWPYGKARGIRFDGSPVQSNVFSEIYLNPCYGQDDTLPSTGIPECMAIPQNDRVRTLRGYGGVGGSEDGHDDNMKRSPLVVAKAGNLSVPTKARFSPDEGYAEESLEGTEV